MKHNGAKIHQKLQLIWYNKLLSAIFTEKICGMNDDLHFQKLDNFLKSHIILQNYDAKYFRNIFSFNMLQLTTYLIIWYKKTPQNLLRNSSYVHSHKYQFNYFFLPTKISSNCSGKFCIVANASPSHFEAHVGLFRLLLKGIFDPYVLWPKVI